MPFLAMMPLSPLSGLNAYLLSDAFPCKLHFPDSLVSSRVRPMGGSGRLEGRMEGEACAYFTLSLCHRDIFNNHCISSTVPTPTCNDGPFLMGFFFFFQQLLKIAILERVSLINWLGLHHVPTPREREDRFLLVSLEEDMHSLCYQNDTCQGRTIPSNEIKMLWKGIDVGQPKAKSGHFLHIILCFKIHDWSFDINILTTPHFYCISQTPTYLGSPFNLHLLTRH